jgi:hypothetical protein
MKTWLIISLIGLVCICPKITKAQIFEAYAGHQRIGVDILWFNYFKSAKDEKTPILFFSRNRASVDFHGSPGSFGSTQAVSYNFENGLGVVVVASFLHNGFTPKAGIQFNTQSGPFLFFGWWVVDIKNKSHTDLFGLFRYQPPLWRHWKLFSQLELFPSYRIDNRYWNLTERFRLGLRNHGWAGGWMLDLNQQGINRLSVGQNLGLFIRHEF